jgi:hypothetical protein
MKTSDKYFTMNLISTRVKKYRPPKLKDIGN